MSGPTSTISKTSSATYTASSPSPLELPARGGARPLAQGRLEGSRWTTVSWLVSGHTHRARCPSRSPARLWALAVPAALALTLAGAGCGGSGDSTTPGAKSKQASKEAAGNGDWAFFGRVGTRTHSLPAKGL